MARMIDMQVPTRSNQCPVAVWKRDTYRYTGRGPGGFEMHHQRSQCARRCGSHEVCTQHWKMLERGHSFFRFDDHSPIRYALRGGLR